MWFFPPKLSKSASLTHFRSCDRHDLRNLTSLPWPNVVSQIWEHSEWWVWRRRFLKKFIMSAILTYLKSCDLNELCNSCYQSGEERCFQISAGSAQWFGRRSLKSRWTVRDDNTWSGIQIPDKLKMKTHAIYLAKACLHACPNPYAFFQLARMQARKNPTMSDLRVCCLRTSLL